MCFTFSSDVKHTLITINPSKIFILPYVQQKMLAFSSILPVAVVYFCLFSSFFFIFYLHNLMKPEIFNVNI